MTLWSSEVAASVRRRQGWLFFTSLRKGLARARANLSLVFLLWGINLIVAGGLTVPLYRLLDGSLSFSLESDRSLGSPDIEWLAGFLFYQRESLSSLSGIVVWTLGVYLFLTTLLSAGMVEVLLPSARFSIGRFLGGIARHGLRFAQLFVVSLAVYSAIFFLFHRVMTRGWWVIGGLDRLTKEWMSEGAVFAVYTAKNIVLAVVLLFAVMVFDYARIRIVTEPSRRVLGAARDAACFVRHNLGATLGVFYGFGALNVLVIGIYLAVERWLPATLMVLIAAGLIWGQLLMIARMWLRVALMAGEIELYYEATRLPPSPGDRS